MMTDDDSLPAQPAPTPARPLLGMTVLLVEDSLFASDAIRLLCLRSGARIRRADRLRSARRHLQVYRPSVVIVDMGLPDGSGLDLITELDGGRPRVGVILATSARGDGAERAASAGADGFLPKPVASLAAFQGTILAHCPTEQRPAGPRRLDDETVQPDLMALREDMAHAAVLLDDTTRGAALDYVARFLEGVARTAGDRPLAEAAASLLRGAGDDGTAPARAARLAGMVQDRLGDRLVI